MRQFFPIFTALLISLSSGFSQSIDSLKIPQLLTAGSGQIITTSKQWEKTRRPEIIEQFKELMYGRVPEKHYELVTRVVEQSNSALNGKAIRKQVELKIFNKAKTDSVVSMLLIYLPHSAVKVPVFLTLNYKGNHTCSSEPEVYINQNWSNPEGETFPGYYSGEESRGKRMLPIELMLESGYGIATMHYGDFAPDSNTRFQEKLIQLFFRQGQTTRGDNEWGSISAWAFGLSRAMDYLVTDHGCRREKKWWSKVVQDWGKLHFGLQPLINGLPLLFPTNRVMAVQRSQE